MTNNIWHQYYKKSIAERLAILQESGYLSEEELEHLADNTSLPTDLANNMSENVIGTYGLPFSIALNFLINDKDYIIPMAMEEPSVVAAASFAAQTIARNGGFKTKVKSRLMTGQIAFTSVDSATADMLAEWVTINTNKLIRVANDAHPSIVKRGGGAHAIRTNYFPTTSTTASFFVIYLTVDTQEAMGANMMNTMLEALKAHLTLKFRAFDQKIDPLMAILSNNTTECLVEAQCEIKSSDLAKAGINGQEVSRKIGLASQLAQVDTYRAVTHNKGIMNGIDGVLIATGNDWRAIEAGAHAYAARDGQYLGLATWNYDEHTQKLIGKITLPMPVGVVGGSIGIHPTAKIAHDILGQPSAQQLMQIIAAVGLGQNLAAVRALVSEGIQAGHMSLQARSLAIQVGATAEEVEQVAKALSQAERINQNTAANILKDIRHY